MSEKTAPRNKAFENWIPDEARQHARSAREEMKKSMAAFFPPEFAEHRRQARKEFLLAFRSVIDTAIERTEERDKRKK